jgi:hypothetical protein
MAKTLTITQENFQKGLRLLEDGTKAPFGSARRMLNVIISDRGGITTRPGTELLGTINSTDSPVKGVFNFKKSQGSAEILMKAYATYLEYYDPDAGWSVLKSGFTNEQEFGFTSSLVNTSNQDYVYFCNRTEEYQRWRGETTLLNGALSGGETAITVDSTLKDNVYYSGTATANSATTVTVSTATWATDMWKNFVIHIIGTGKVRRITGNTTNVITFDTLTSGPGNVAFEIRQLAFPLYNIGTVTTNGTTTLTGSGTNFTSVYRTGDSIYVDGETVRTVSAVASDTSLTVTAAFSTSVGSLKHKSKTELIYNGTTIEYTDIDLATTFTVASAHAASDNTAVTIVPQVFIAAPRGNRIENLMGRVYVGNVRSAVSRDSAGALQGSDQAGSVFVSKLLDPSTFTFSASRVAGEGDIINMPYGGGEVTDLKAQESTMYAFKEGYIESITYTQDTNDYAVREPLKTGKGSIGKVIKGTDDLYFMTLDSQYTSLGRVRAKDLKPQTENIGLPIKRLLEAYDHTDFNGIEFNNRIFSCHKSTSDETYNNVVIVFNKQTGSFEGFWTLSAGYFFEYYGDLYYAESNGANVWKMLTSGKSDIEDSSTKYPVTSDWKSNFFNVLPIKNNVQAVNSVYLEGYITANTSFTFSLYKDFSDQSVLSFTFGGTEDNLIVGDTLNRFMGSTSLSLEPLGTIEAPGSDGRRRFQFIVYFPYIYGNTFSTGISSTGKDQDWELIRLSLGLKEDVSTKITNIKSI